MESSLPKLREGAGQFYSQGVLLAARKSEKQVKPSCLWRRWILVTRLWNSCYFLRDGWRNCLQPTWDNVRELGAHGGIPNCILRCCFWPVSVLSKMVITKWTEKGCAKTVGKKPHSFDSVNCLIIFVFFLGDSRVRIFLPWEFLPWLESPQVRLELFVKGSWICCQARGEMWFLSWALSV